jgi:thiamine-phosphate pyrophosphorylase
MSADRPQIYLVTPPAFDPAPFAEALAPMLDAVPVACLRLSLATQSEEAVIRAADALRTLAHARDLPLVIERHVGLVTRLGLDGVHLPDGARGVRKARAALGADAIIGAHCRASRHEGITAAETGADYIAFGPVGGGALGDGTLAEPALFEWWSEMIELPVVAEGGLTPALVESLAPVTDFFAFGEEVWTAPDPLAALRDLAAPLLF